MPDIYALLMAGIASRNKVPELVPLLTWEDILEARRAYAVELGRSVDTLTKTEKQLAMLNLVMEKLEQ